MFSERRCSYKFLKIHRKHLCYSLFFNKLAGVFQLKYLIIQILYISSVVFVAIGNFYYVTIYHSINFFWYIVLYSITIANYDYRRKVKNRKNNINLTSSSQKNSTGTSVGQTTRQR